MNILLKVIKEWWHNIFIKVFIESLKLNKTWARFFWMVCAIAIFDSSATILEYIKFKTELGNIFVVPLSLHLLFLTSLSMYVISNVAAIYWKLRSGIKISKPVEILAMIWITIMCYIIIASKVWDKTHTTPQNIEWMVITVVMLTFGSKPLQKKIAKKFGVIYDEEQKNSVTKSLDK